MYEEFTDLTFGQAVRYCEGSEKQRVRDVIATRVGPNRTVIDLCCGNGIDAYRYNPNKYWGVDISLPLITAARTLNPLHRFQCSDATRTADLPLADCVIIKSALEHVPDEATALALVDSALRLAKQEVFIAWHTPPREDVPVSELRRVQGHFGLWTSQNQYAMAPFRRFMDGYHGVAEIIDNFQLWTLKKEKTP